MKFHFKKLLQNEGWLENIAVEVDKNGLISSIVEITESTDIAMDFAIPGFQDAHSHSFQYAMAGLAETHSNSVDRNDFWNWREAMYSLALSVNPDQFESIATMLYAEMLRYGYTNVAEFHYLHHDKNGKPYDNLAEMGSRLISAAKTVGIGITLIPIFYQKGGFNQAPAENQKRFISKTIDDYQKLYEATKIECQNYELANIGIGIHSMRGVEPETIKEVANNFPQDVPFHIHISEQLKEVDDCLEVFGKKPVQWMLDNIELSDRFHFVHATHLDDFEVKGLAKTNVNVVLCPTTEGNLGDGFFPLHKFQEAGGHWSIGTDSHVSLNPFEELRLLDYGQRLKSHRRNTFGENSGKYAIKQVTLTGRKAMNNFEKRYFAIGQPFNACVISAAHPLLQTASNENILNTIIYSYDKITGTISNGKWLIKNGEFVNQEKIYSDFSKTIHELKNR